MVLKGTKHFPLLLSRHYSVRLSGGQRQSRPIFDRRCRSTNKFKPTSVSCDMRAITDGLEPYGVRSLVDSVPRYRYGPIAVTKCDTI